MSTQRFQNLCDGLCDLLEEPRFPAGDGILGSVAFNLSRQGVMANVMYFPQSWENHAFVLIEFGAIPEQHPRVAEIVMALLHANFLVPQPMAPALGCNPVTGEVVLRCEVGLADATPQSLLGVLDRGVALALSWRQHFFLTDDAPLPQVMDAGAISPESFA
jgi:hypothetical protein